MPVHVPYVYTGEDQKLTPSVFLHHSPSYLFEAGSLTEHWSSLILLDCLTRKPQGSSSLCFHSTMIIGMCNYTSFLHEYWGFELGSLCLYEALNPLNYPPISLICSYIPFVSLPHSHVKSRKSEASDCCGC